MNYKDQVLPDYQFEGKTLTQSIVKQILMQRAELPYFTTEEWAEYVRDCCGKNGEKPPEKDLRTIVAKALISLNHERLAHQKVSLDRSTSQWKVFREQYTLQKKTIVAPFYQSREWKDASRLYRHEQDWQCEECKLSLDSYPDRKYLHTHHTKGTQHNDPEDLRALCIGCHSEHHQRRVGGKRTLSRIYGEIWRTMEIANC